MTGRDHTSDGKLLAALRHPLRRRILREMADGKPISPRELSLRLRQPLSNVSYHVRVLAECEAATLVETKPVRGSVQHVYRSKVEAPWAREMLELEDKESDDGGDSSRSPTP